MNEAQRKFARALKESTKRKAIVGVPAFLGDANGTVKTTNRRVYARLYNGDIIELVNQRVPNVPDRPVLIGYDPLNPNTLQVLGSWEVYQDDLETYGDVGEHHATHEWDGPDTTWIRGEQFRPFLVTPYSGLTVQIFGGLLLGPYGWVTVSEQTMDLSAYQPTAGAVYLLLQVDLSTGDVEVKEGFPVSDKNVLTDEEIPDPDDEYYPLAIVRLYDGQDELHYTRTNNDFKDPRWAGFASVAGSFDVGAALDNAAEDTGLNDADKFGFFDSVELVLKTITWANIKFVLKTYFDTVYAAITHVHAGADITSGTIDGDRLPAMSATKKGGVPATGTPSGLFLKDDGTWASGGGGVTVHSALTGLDYASAGHTGFQPAMSGADVLALLLTVDGTGSLLDADLLDGNEAAAFALAGHNHAGVYQPLDATLTSIAALGTAADKMLYTTAIDTWAETPLTAAGRALLDDATAADQRTTLGLAAGGAGDIWVEKAGDTMTGPFVLQPSADSATAFLLKTTAGVELIRFDTLSPVSGNPTLKITNAAGGEIFRALRDSSKYFRVFIDASSAKTEFVHSGVTGGFGYASSTVYFFTTSAHPLVFKTNNTERMRILSTGELGLGIATPAVKFHEVSETTTANAILEAMRIETRVSTASTGASAGFGVGQTFYAESGTDASYRQMGQLDFAWVVATDASRTARGTLNVYDTAKREAMRFEASGSAAMLGFFGVNAIARPTTAHAAATFAQNSGNAVNDASTFDGYTLLQVVKALRDVGLLT